MANTLQGKVALVTGASSGIGEATAYALAAQGAYVAASARRADRLNAVVKRIQDSGGQAISIVADIADEAQANDTVNRTVGRWGRLDILVNNAGVMLLGKIAKYRRLAAHDKHQYPWPDVYHPRGLGRQARAEEWPYRQHLLGGRPYRS